MWDALGADETAVPAATAADAAVHARRPAVPDGPRQPARPARRVHHEGPDAWAKRVANVEADVVCVGHTHMQFNLAVDGVVVLNPGSVGQPRDGDPRAAYAVIDDNKIELKRVEYPVEETVARIEASPAPGEGQAAPRPQPPVRPTARGPAGRRGPGRRTGLLRSQPEAVRKRPAKMRLA